MRARRLASLAALPLLTALAVTAMPGMASASQVSQVSLARPGQCFIISENPLRVECCGLDGCIIS